MTNENIERIRQLIQDDPHISYKYMEEETSLCRKTIQDIIHEQLEMTRLASRWVPYKLNDAQRTERVEACRKNLAFF